MYRLFLYLIKLSSNIGMKKEFRFIVCWIHFCNICFYFVTLGPNYLDPVLACCCLKYLSLELKTNKKNQIFSSHIRFILSRITSRRGQAQVHGQGKFQAREPGKGRGQVWVQGEAQGFNIMRRSNHLYFLQWSKLETKE